MTVSHENISDEEQDEVLRTPAGLPRVPVSAVRQMLSAISICEVILILAKLDIFDFLVLP